MMLTSFLKFNSCCNKALFLDFLFNFSIVIMISFCNSPRLANAPGSSLICFCMAVQTPQALVLSLTFPCLEVQTPQTWILIYSFAGQLKPHKDPHASYLYHYFCFCLAVEAVSSLIFFVWHFKHCKLQFWISFFLVWQFKSHKLIFFVWFLLVCRVWEILLEFVLAQKPPHLKIESLVMLGYTFKLRLIWN